jgi:2-iminoacetate synthase ThiH
MMNDEIDNELKNIYYEDLIIIEAKTEKAKEVAIKLLTNLDIKFISQITGLSVEEILELPKHI